LKHVCKTSKNITFLVFLLVLFSSTVLYASDEKLKKTKLYIGGGGSYALGNFDFDQNEFKVEFDDVSGINAKAGYSLNRLFSLEFNFNYLPNFPWDGLIDIPGIHINENIDITTYVLSGKFSPNFKSKIAKPFVTVGAGILHGSGKISRENNFFFISETKACAKGGWGIDFFLNKNFSIGIEWNYIFSFDDIKEIGYSVYTLGVIYHIY